MRITCIYFFECPFSQGCWLFLDIHWDTSLNFRARQLFGLTIFREIIIMAMWAIWTQRNSIIFDATTLSFATWRRNFSDGMKAVTLRAKPLLKDNINSWMIG